MERRRGGAIDGMLDCIVKGRALNLMPAVIDDTERIVRRIESERRRPGGVLENSDDDRRLQSNGEQDRPQRALVSSIAVVNDDLGAIPVGSRASDPIRSNRGKIQLPLGKGNELLL